MRLIDADKIDFGKVFIGASDFAKDTREAAQELIDKQPTAYDMDEVIDAVRGDCYALGLDESSTEIIVDDIKSGGINKSIG